MRHGYWHSSTVAYVFGSGGLRAVQRVHRGGSGQRRDERRIWRHHGIKDADQRQEQDGVEKRHAGCRAQQWGNAEWRADSERRSEGADGQR
ncbi:MAG: hypothetical protein GY832_13155 [Chloroflexi bacterium]|nr:hypothetical protein [Chloroflexota bacterium]